MSKILPAAQSVAQIVDTIHEISKSHAPIEAAVGVVIQAFFELKIAYNNLVLTRQDLYINDFLLKKYARLAQGQIQQKEVSGRNFDVDAARGNISTNTQPKRGGFGKPSFVSHNHKLDGKYKASFKGDFTSDEMTSEYKEVFIFENWGLNVGDLVALLPVNGGQKFILLGRIYPMAELSEGDFND